MTDVILTEGITVQFELPETKSKSNFVYFPSNDGNLKIKVVELLGNLTVSIENAETKKPISCPNPKDCLVAAQEG